MQHDLPKNDISLLILSVLMEGNRHGYAIAREIERMSSDTLKMREGTLYPALRILEQDEMIESHWETPERGPARKIYTLTQKGRMEQTKRAQEWRQYASVIGAIVGGKRPDENPI